MASETPTPSFSSSQPQCTQVRSVDGFAVEAKLRLIQIEYLVVADVDFVMLHLMQRMGAVGGFTGRGLTKVDFEDDPGDNRAEWQRVGATALDQRSRKHPTCLPRRRPGRHG